VGEWFEATTPHRLLQVQGGIRCRTEPTGCIASFTTRSTSIWRCFAGNAIRVSDGLASASRRIACQRERSPGSSSSTSRKPWRQHRTLRPHEFHPGQERILATHRLTSVPLREGIHLFPAGRVRNGSGALEGLRHSPAFARRAQGGLRLRDFLPTQKDH